MNIDCQAADKVLRWMCGVTKMTRIRNESIRGTIKMGEISRKVQEISK